jgi:Flp pilus assembly protein TadB
MDVIGKRGGGIFLDSGRKKGTGSKEIKENIDRELKHYIAITIAFFILTFIGLIIMIILNVSTPIGTIFGLTGLAYVARRAYKARKIFKNMNESGI